MRKIDTASFNKRLFAEITELKSLLDRISPEHIKYFDSELIQEANRYVDILGKSVWSDNCNFNGIEMHKIKQMINYIKTSKKKLFVNRIIESIGEYDDDGYFAYSKYTIKVPDGYDGRSSFIFPRILVEETLDGVVLRRYLTPKEITFNCNAPDKTIEYPPYIYAGTPKTRLEISKNKDNITVFYAINLRNTQHSQFNNPVPVVVPSDVTGIYLDCLYLIWKDKA